jgi:hypothetical protein
LNVFVQLDINTMRFASKLSLLALCSFAAASPHGQGASGIFASARAPAVEIQPYSKEKCLQVGSNGECKAFDDGQAKSANITFIKSRIHGRIEFYKDYNEDTLDEKPIETKTIIMGEMADAAERGCTAFAEEAGGYIASIEHFD